jgi:hypothetical protein
MQIDPRAGADMIATLRRQGARGLWLRLLAAVLELAGSRAEFLRHTETPWSSVTFTGSRHAIELRFSGAEAVAAGEAFVEALPEHEFALPGQLVADAAIVSVDHSLAEGPVLTLKAELLLLEEC